MWLLVSLWATSSVLGSGSVNGQEQSPPVVTERPAAAPFIRILRDAEGKPTALQTATARYVSENGAVSVDLIGAVHIGDKEYYEALNTQFANYEVLLYELVAEHGTVIPKGGGEKRGGNPLSMMHSMAQSVLGLESQLEQVDYTKNNFVHADMTPGEMSDAMKERGDTPLTFALSAFTEAMRAQNRRTMAQEEAGQEVKPDPIAEVDIFSMLTDKNAGSKLKVTLAEQFGATGALDQAFGKTVNQAIVVDRNKAALKVFQKQLTAGKRNMGIFYGAAHLPDFETRLKDDFGMRRTGTNWTTAWDLTKEAPKDSASPLSVLFRLMSE